MVLWSDIIWSFTGSILSLSLPFFSFFLLCFLSFFFLNYPGWYGWHMLCSILSIVSKSRPFTSFCYKVSVESMGIFATLLPISPKLSISLQKEITFFILELDTSFLPAKFTCWTQPLYFPSQISVSSAPQPNTCKYICKYPARKQQRTF